MNYVLDTNLAREGSGSTSAQIRETGKYIGDIEWARERQFSNSNAVEIRFKSDRGTTNLMLFVDPKEDGSVNFGVKQLNAIMACCKTKQITATQGEVEAWNPETKQVEKMPAVVFPELAGKPIGLLLEAEHDVYEGKPTVNMWLKAPFTADTEQTAKEVLENKGVAETISKMVPLLKDRYKSNVQPMQSAQQGPAPAGSDFDDDIPF